MRYIRLIEVHRYKDRYHRTKTYYHIYRGEDNAYTVKTRKELTDTEVKCVTSGNTRTINHF